ncbi:MAG: M16 family metallopeptidase [Pseudomonadota bacterium]
MSVLARVALRQRPRRLAACAALAIGAGTAVLAAAPATAATPASSTSAPASTTALAPAPRPLIRQPAPAVGTPRDFALPAKSEIRLANGIPVTHVPFGTVPKATILVVVRTGNIDDGARTGLADIAVEMLKEGAGARSAAEVAQFAADMGGALAIGAGADQTSAALDVLAERAPDAVALLADVLRRPRLPESELPRLQANALRQLAVARAQPQAIARDALARRLWGDHPYGRGLPTDADVQGHTIEDVRRFVADNFGAARTRIYVAGRYDLAAVDRALEAALGDWAAGRPPTENVPTGTRTRQVVLIDRPDAAQSTLLLGVPSIWPGVPGYLQFTVANTLLGGSLISRLNQNLREEKGYTYGANSSLSLRFRSGSWVLATDVNTPDTAAALREIYFELDRLRREPPAAEELRRIQNLRAGNFVIGTSSAAGLAGQMQFLDFHDLPDDWLTNWVRNVYAVTPEQVSEVTRRHLDPAQMTLIVVGDAQKIGAELRSLPALQGAQFLTPAPQRP